MSLLEITGLTQTFGDTRLFKEAEFTLNKGEHVGVVGHNGVGKSTLIKICTGQMIPDAGEIIWQPQITIGSLDQYARIGSDLTIKEFLQSAFSNLYKLEEKMNYLYNQTADGNLEGLSLESRYQEELERKEFYFINTRIERVAAGMGLTAIGLNRTIEQLSGGQRAKVILAKLLLEEPDVLLLDEPTNFLDKEHITWLSEYLGSFSGAFMVVSHDKGFLEKVSAGICDIDNARITKYVGTYSEFIRKKTLLRADYIRQYTAQQKDIKKTEEFIRKNIAGRKTKMASGRQKQLARMDKMEALEQKELKPYFHFTELASSTIVNLEVETLAIGYQDPVLADLNFTVKGGEKVVITGFNGIGKSTLLKTLIGQIPLLGGKFRFAEKVVTGYFEQDLTWDDQKLTPIQTIANAYPSLTTKEVRKELARCGISSKHTMQAIDTLSGGEQAKVKMCLLTLTPCNFLIMDEPTNHLDTEAKKSLRAALTGFGGTVLLVSHEEAFYQEWVQKVIHIGK